MSYSNYRPYQIWIYRAGQIILTLENDQYVYLRINESTPTLSEVTKSESPRSMRELISGGKCKLLCNMDKLMLDLVKEVDYDKIP